MFMEMKDIFTVAGPTTTGRPYLNENQLGALSTSSTFLADKRTLMNWIKRTPEAIGIIRQIAVDVITKLDFVSIEEKGMGRPKKDLGKDNESKAYQFSRSNFLKQQLRAAVMEGIALGDGYLWKGKVNKSEMMEIYKKTLKQFGITDIEYKDLDEDPLGQKAIRYVPSATMDIEIDESGTKIKSFIQRTSLGYGKSTYPSATLRSTQEGTKLGGTRKWNPKDIIHYKFMDIDGKAHGFTPMQSSFPIIKTLGAIKDYHGHYFESGLMPDIIFNFEELDANSPEYHKMEQVIQEWWNNQRRSHAITSSKFKIEKINEWNKDMEFRMLAIYYTGVIAFSLGMPLEKIRAILGGEIKSTSGGSDISNTDYQRNIYDMQDDWEALLNTQFFNEEFNVNLKFERSAARDEIAEVMRDQQKINILDKFKQMDLINSENYVHFVEKLFPDIPTEWLNKNPKPEMNMGQMIPSSKILPKGQAQEALSEEKKKQQEPQQKNKPPKGI